MKSSLIAIVVLLVALLGFVTWRSTRAMTENLPPHTECMNAADAWQKAATYTLNHGGNVIAVAGTGSMAPYIPAAAAGREPRTTIVAYAVVDSRATYKDVKQGKLCTYRPEWNPALSVLHVAALHDSRGWIMSGLHNKTYENAVRVTEKNFTGITVAVFTWEQ